jgi:PAS domain-containing protein
VFAHSPVPYIVFRADGRALLWNQAYRDMFAAEPPPEYDVLRDEQSELMGIGPAVRRRAC